MAMKYTQIFHSKAYKNERKLRFLVRKKPSGNPGSGSEIWVKKIDDPLSVQLLYLMAKKIES
jgi:hypothetical protein